jgi:hypothetical protein
MKKPLKSTPALNRLLKLYYLMTPAFFLFDYLFQVNIRLGGIDNQSLKFSWYTVCLMFGVLFHFRPSWSVLLSLLESLSNLLFLMVLFAIPVMTPDIEAIERGVITITKSSVINFMISGSICILVFERAKLNIKHHFSL